MLKRSTPLIVIFLLGAWLGLSAQTITVSMSSTPACSLDGSATAMVSGGVAPYTYTWYWGNQQTLTTTSNTLSNLAGGNVSVSVSDANNATSWGWVLVTPPFNLQTSSIPDTCSSGVGSATIMVNGGTPPYTYLWSTGATTASVSGLLPGQYDVTVQDAAGCSYASSDADSGGVWIWDWSPITVTANSTPSSCVDGTATVSASNGTAPYTYYWHKPWDPTFSTQTTQTATNLPVGGIYCTVTDASGCSTDRYIYIQQGIPPFQTNITKTPELCLTANGSISLAVTGSSGPYTYNWSNGATTPSISGLSSQTYSVTITDNNGCPVVKYIYVPRQSPITLSLSSTNPTCGMNNGSVTANPANGTAPYTYLWSNGSTSQTASGLTQGYYSVQVTDANGCTEHEWAYIEYPLSCYGVISGTVRQDNAGSCNPVAGNVPLPNVPVYNGNSYDLTNSAGEYLLTELPGTYNIAQTVPLYHNQTCPGAPGTISATLSGAGAVSSGNDFYNAPIVPVQDLRVSMYCGPARPGFNQHVRIFAYNQGTFPVTANLSFTHDAAVNYNYALPVAANYVSTTQTATWSLGTIAANDYEIVDVYLQVPTSTSLGTQLNSSVSLSPIANDSTPVNNVDSCFRIVTGSYDPNDKSVVPAGDIAADQLLEYRIRFQNTGTDTAFTVMISDTLDSNLDPLTFVQGVASHPYTVDLSGPGILEWTFDNILLPDSNVNEPESHGFVTFYIKPKPGLAPGTRIPNTAAIYFDYNAPIITNTVESTIEGLTNVEDVLSQGPVQVYPNPTKDLATVAYTLDHAADVNISLYDLRGQKVYDSGLLEQNAGDQRHVLSTDRADIADGIYMVKVAIGSQVHVQKLSVLR